MPPREAQVRELHHQAVRPAAHVQRQRGHQDVPRGQVPVDEQVRVQVSQGGRHLKAHGVERGVCHGHLLAGVGAQELEKIAVLAQLHGQKGRHAALLHAQDGHQVWMLETGVDARLEQQLCQLLRSVGVGHLDGNMQAPFCSFLGRGHGARNLLPDGVPCGRHKTGLVHDAKVTLAKEPVLHNVDVGDTQETGAVASGAGRCQRWKFQPKEVVRLDGRRREAGKGT